jgi:putative ABC transport system ATP-binding protein
MSPVQTDGCVARLTEVTRIYGATGRETVALRGVSLAVHAGETVLLLGPSGSGKTTLLTLLGGLQHPTTGTVEIFGRAVEDYSLRDLQRLRATRIGFVFQTFRLLEPLSVLDNVLLVMRFAGVPRALARRRALALLHELGIDDLAGVRPATLSQGQKQRVAVARALANDAELIIADEPTGNLATAQGLDIVRLLTGKVRERNHCAVIVSHDERIADYADRVFHLEDGALRTAQGPT